MNVSNEKILLNKYPKVFSDYGVPKSSMSYGFSNGDGWFGLIDFLCESIQGYIDARPDVEQVIAEQVKEKFGGLRFYYRGGDKYIDDIVSFAENISFHICETCGTTINVKLVNKNGYIRTVCDKCKDDWIKK